MIISHLPVVKWWELFEDNTYADACLSRIVFILIDSIQCVPLLKEIWILFILIIFYSASILEKNIQISSMMSSPTSRRRWRKRGCFQSTRCMSYSMNSMSSNASQNPGKPQYRAKSWRSRNSYTVISVRSLSFNIYYIRAIFATIFSCFLDLLMLLFSQGGACFGPEGKTYREAEVKS